MSLAGRGDETAVVLACIEGAASGSASTLLVRGEPGVGKTSLVTDACRAANALVETLWAGCLPLTSMTAPLLPLRAFLRRADLGEDVTLVEFDDWLDRATAVRPVVLVVDDLQWADRSSLDVLLYVIAGRADRRLGLIATVRAGAEGDGLSEWLAHVQRLPRVRELVLDRLDRAGTGEQLTGMFGRPPDEGLVDQVHARTRGNPYLTSLLVHGLDPRARHLPESRPARLRDAVIRPWQAMSDQARTLSSILAVGGHPQTYDALTHSAPALGFVDPVLPALREAVGRGVLLVAPDGRYWFTHPLLAELLDENLLPDQRRQMHASYVSVLGDCDAVDLADHCARAGMTEPAFRWALRAAETTAQPAEQLRLLRRALSLWPRLREPGTSRVELWERIRASAGRAGSEQDGLEATEALIALAPDREPLRRGRLMLERAQMRYGMGLDGPMDPLLHEVIAFTAQHPDSVEHALATAAMAKSMLLVDNPDGVALAATALRLAEACGAEEAIAEALISMAYARRRTGRPGAADDARRAWEIASRLRLFTLLKKAAYTASNVTEVSARERAGIYRRAADELSARGAPHSHVAEMRAWEADVLLWIGDWRGCHAGLRIALGARPGPRGDARARVTAAHLACLQGRQDEAEAHLARAEEIFPVHRAGELSFLYFEEVQALVALTAGAAERAYSIAWHDIERDGYAEEMLPIAARALADQAEACRDEGRDSGPVLVTLAEFRRCYPVVMPDGGATLPDEERRALQTLADAETARATHGSGELSLWCAAAHACRDADRRWDEAYARWRQALAALRDRRRHRDAAEALRAAHRRATDLGAAKLLTDVARLARAAHVDLTGGNAVRTGPPPDLPGLTRREREVLGHLFAGGTNAEIAKALVLSEKTVGVHISNMLRKTGTTNRVQLAELARRHQKRKSEEHGDDF